MAASGMGGGGEAGFTASTSGPSDSGDWPDHNSRCSSNDHPSDAAAAAPLVAVSGRGRRPQPRSRGRPPGSKNKPKPPVVITRESPGALRFHVLHVESGADVVGAVASFARRQGVGVVILGCSGAVANVAVREPLPAVAATTIRGRYEILSLRGCFLPEKSPQWAATGLAVFLAAGRGEVLGGNVVGPMEASGPVMLVAATFSPSTATYNDWSSLEEGQPAARATGGGAGEGVQLHQSSGADAGGGGGGWVSSLDPAGAAGAAAMPVYNLPPNLVANNDQIPDAVFAGYWTCSAARPPAPPSDYK